MYLKTTNYPKTGRAYLSLTEGYRENGKSKSRTVEGLGYLDELEKHYDDPIAHFKAEAKRRTAELQARKAEVIIKIKPGQRIDKKTPGNRKNIGSAVPMAYYNDLLIERVIRNASRGRRFEYDANAILRLLVIERLLNPGSKLVAFKNRHHYFFRSDFSDDDMYRSLDFFCLIKDRIVASMNRQIKAQGKRDTSAVFYDVTNYHFEIDQ